MKRLLLILSFSFLIVAAAHAQTGREVDGKVVDSAKTSIRGAAVKLITDKGDSTVAVTDSAGKFVFTTVKSNKFTLTISSPGYPTLRRRFGLDTTGKAALLDPIVLTKSRTIRAPIATRSQADREVDGTVIDSTKTSIPGATVKLITSKGDSSVTVTDGNGKFVFPSVGSNRFTLTVTSLGYQPLKRRFGLDTSNKTAILDPIILKSDARLLSGVTIVGINPVVLKEDTVEYKASAYKVRENAPVEDLIKKLPGVDVDVNGNITTQGKQVTKVRINGKDFMGGDVQAATKNLPADIVENIQMIDDYGDQAALTGIKTGEPDKIMNITIRKDRNYGYSLQSTVGDGEDALPASQSIPDQNRYLGTLNFFHFSGDQQIAVLGSVNNTNVNTFSFGSPGGGGGGGFGGGGGRGNAGRGGGGNGSLITNQNGITEAHSLGANFRDQWGKYLSVYGSYSFADNTTSTNNTNLQQNFNPVNPSVQNQTSAEVDRNTNHRFTWNMEYKPDTVNYLKVTPTFSYAGTNTRDNENSNLARTRDTTAYNSLSTGHSQSPTYGVIALYNRRLGHRRNFSINANFSSSTNNQYQNPTYDYIIGTPTAPTYQTINTHSHTNTIGTTLSYIEPLGKTTYLELNYSFSHAMTDNNKSTDTAELNNPLIPLVFDDSLSTNYNYTFTTHRIGVNFRDVKKSYNFTLGVAAMPSYLDGYSPLTNATTHESNFNIIPTARYVYNFSRSQLLSINYNGSSSSPNFTQLQPTTDFSNALYPVQGNPNLKPQFTNSFTVRYNKFSFATGNIFFIYGLFQQINDQVVTNTITYPRHYTPNPRFDNTILTQYLNANGYYTINSGLLWAKPWDNRKFTLYLRGNVSYVNNVGYLTNIDSASFAADMQKNISKNLQFTPQVQFRVDITDVMDAQFMTNYAINHTSNSVSNSITSGTANIRTWNIGLNGKQYILKDWTFSYDYIKAINYGYAPGIPVTNPNILNVYLERRFLKHNAATIRIGAFDLFNQNTGFTSSTTASALTESRVNRLSRYYLATFTLRLQKFAGKAPTQNIDRGFRRGDGGGRRGGGGPGGD
ncbi:MAG: outer membrane beta-barrel protein [Bacteroidetes bacterium]|nr:outer membrane beta-barrel protein [Bacteroidota bacterium]